MKEIAKLAWFLLGFLVLIAGGYGYVKAYFTAPDPYAQCERPERLEELKMTAAQCRAAVATGLNAGH